MKIIFLGDSTMQYNDETTFPQTGWPQALEGRFKEDVQLINCAKNGRSTKSFIEEGLFENALKKVDSESIVIIEFGHNDSHDYDLERYTRPDYEYHDNLSYMVSECKKKGAYVLLLTPVYRRWFNEDGSIKMNCHTGYREAMIRLSEESNTDLIDMCTLTREKIAETGDEKSKEYFMNFPAGMYPNYPDGLEDNTHLRMKGAKMIAEIFIEQIKDNPHFKELLNV